MEGWELGRGVCQCGSAASACLIRKTVACDYRSSVNQTNKKLSYEESYIYEDVMQNNSNWSECLLGKNGASGIVEYMDSMAAENAYIAHKQKQVTPNSTYTHVEIHPSFMFGVMGNQAVFPEHNPGVRNCYFTGQAKQAVSLYHSNFDSRIDKMGVVLQYGQTPLIRSKYTQYIQNDENPYGVNTIVAIMSYTGYNVEDAIIFNQAAIDRGLFNMTYYSSYEAYEGSNEEKESATVSHQFANVKDINMDIKNIKSGYDYGYLDEHGLIQENVELTEKMVVIGKVSYDMERSGEALDESIATKKGQAGFVDKTFIEGGKEAKEPVLLVSVAAVFKNPWDQQGFVENLKPTILDLAPKLGNLLVPELIKSQCHLGQMK